MFFPGLSDLRTTELGSWLALFVDWVSEACSAPDDAGGESVPRHFRTFAWIDAGTFGVRQYAGFGF